MSKEKFEAIVKIVDRAEQMHITAFDRISLIMDMEVATGEFNLRLEDLLNADDFNFAHDVCGIQRNINRETKKIDNFFVPRFARN